MASRRLRPTPTCVNYNFKFEFSSNGNSYPTAPTSPWARSSRTAWSYSAARDPCSPGDIAHQSLTCSWYVFSLSVGRPNARLQRLRSVRRLISVPDPLVPSSDTLDTSAADILWLTASPGIPGRTQTLPSHWNRTTAAAGRRRRAASRHARARGSPAMARPPPTPTCAAPAPAAPPPRQPPHEPRPSARHKAWRHPVQ